MTDGTKSWLEELGLGQYADVFAANDIDLDVVFDLTDQDLKELGVSLGHRKRLLKAISGMSDADATAAAGRAGAAAALPRARRDAGSRAEHVERRQLTIMFCDLVDSTSLSLRFDPEDLRSIIGQFQRCCERVLEKFGGTIARYMGDALLVYFGYPTATECDAENAVRAGREIVRAVAQLVPLPNVKLQVRVGIATGAVVAGDLIGEGAAEEQAVVGETPNLAKRLEGLAAPDTVVISEATKNLAGELFEYEDLGAHAVKGFDAPVPAWRVGDELLVESRFEALHGRAGLTRLVGRDREIEQLMQSWRRAARAEGHAALLLGDAGIGKSRLVRHLREQAAESPHTVLTYSCVPYYRESPLFPVIQHLERAAGFARDDSPEAKLDKLERLLAGGCGDRASVVPLYASLLGVPSAPRYAPLDLTPRLEKERIFAAFEEQIWSLARDRTVLVIVEDLHWVDPTTLELLDRVVRRLHERRVLVLMTARPSFHVRWADDLCTTFYVNPLTQAQAAAIVTDVSRGKALPHPIVEQILDKADGIPLFVEELTRTMLESGQLIERGDRFEFRGSVPELSVPDTLRDSLTSRLDRLGRAKEIAQLGAVIGRQFTYELLSAIVRCGTDELDDALNRLTDSKLIACVGVPPRSTYTFSHALIQDAAYSSLLRAERRRLHGLIAGALEQRADALHIRPELLAHHYTKAGVYPKAVEYLEEAGHQARQRAAHAEAVKHLTSALELLQSLPDDRERSQAELRLRVALGINLEATGGYAAAEVAQTYARARELCEQLGYTTDRVPVLLGLYVFHLVRADHRTARELAEQCMQLSEGSDRLDYLIDACAALGHVLPHVGELEESVPVLRRCIELSAEQPGRSFTPITAQDPAIASLCQLGVVAWMLGYPDRALEHVARAKELAGALNQPINTALLCPYAAEIHQLRREPAEALEYAATGTRTAQEHGYDYWYLLSVIHLGIATGASGRFAEGWALARGGLDGLRAAGAQANLSYFLGAFAEVAAEAADIDLALQLISEAFEMAERTGERFFLALLYEIRGRIKRALPAPDPAGAERDFLEAVRVARAQRAKSAELRARTSLYRLHLEQGRDAESGAAGSRAGEWRGADSRVAESRAAESRAALADVYGWFSEGFSSGDLRAAEALLAGQHGG